MRPVASLLFQGLSAEEWAALEQSGCLRAKSYPRHAVIFHAGEQVHALGVVLRGTVHIENLDLWGSKSILSSISAGQAFAETYALCGDVMMVDAVAAEECEVLFVNISAFSGGAPGTVHEKLLQPAHGVHAQNLSLSQRIFCTTPRPCGGRLLTYFFHRPPAAAVCSSRSRSTGSSWPTTSIWTAAPSPRSCARCGRGPADLEKNRFALNELPE